MKADSKSAACCQSPIYSVEALVLAVVAAAAVQQHSLNHYGEIHSVGYGDSEMADNNDVALGLDDVEVEVEDVGVAPFLQAASPRSPLRPSLITM